MFEEWLTPILDAMVVEQREQGVVWTPSKMIHRMGREIDNPESVYYWCYKNDIPVYSPAITDGSIGDMIFFHSFKTPGLVLDLVQVAQPPVTRPSSLGGMFVKALVKHFLQDIRGINGMAMRAKHSGAVILGGGVVKHHIMNANLMRNGTDHCVYINTGQEVIF
jgi:deoxyhypusine synthase